MTQLKRFVFMDLKLRVLGTLLVVAASGCVETPVDKNSADLGKFDEGNPCPLDAVTEMIPDPEERRVHPTRASRDYRGWTNIVGSMKPVGKRDWVTFSMILKPGVPPFEKGIVPGVYPLLGEGMHLYLANEGNLGRYLRTFGLDRTAAQGSLELTLVDGRVQGVVKNAVLLERKNHYYDADCPPILVPELQLDATWK